MLDKYISRIVLGLGVASQVLIAVVSQVNDADPVTTVGLLVAVATGVYKFLDGAKTYQVAELQTDLNREVLEKNPPPAHN